MKKRRVLTLLLSICVFTFLLCACSSNVDDSSFEKKQNNVEQDMKEYIVTLEDYRGMTSDDLKRETDEIEALKKNGIITEEVAKINADVLKKWAEIEPEIGKFVDYKEFSFEKAGKTYTATLTCQYENREVDLVYVISKRDFNITGANIEICYSLGEKMSKAGLNTLMGIAIVFVMLVLMSLVIYSFNIIAFFQKKNKIKKKQKEEEKVKKSLEEYHKENSFKEKPIDDVEEDDSELIAVISAAVAAASEMSQDQFIVRSIKRRR